MEQLQLAPDVLLKETYNYILDHPQEHEQTAWAIKDPFGCGTAYCFAGTATQLAGYEVCWNEDSNRAYQVKTPDGPRDIDDVARELLGLTMRQCEDLFDPSNSIEQIHKLLESWEKEV